MKKIFSAALACLSVLSLGSCVSGDDIYGDHTADGLDPNAPRKTIFLQQENVKYDAAMPVYEKANVYAQVNMQGFLQASHSNYATLYNQNKQSIDVVVYDQFTVERDAMSSKLYADLTPYITSELAPNLKKFFDENPEKKDWATASDGKIYGIPFYTDGLTAKAWFIRMDWVRKLDELNKLPKGLEATEESLNKMTVVQYEELLNAFNDNAKALTGKSVIQPYFDRDSEFALSELATLWGCSAEPYLDEDNKVKYGAIQPEFKVAVENMARWYKNGLIDKEILNNTNKKDLRQDYFAGNTGGSTHDWLGSTFGFNEDVYSGVLGEDFELVCILPPTRADGTKVEATARKVIGNVTAINAKTNSEDDIKRLVKWIDFFFSKEGQDLANFGILDEHYKVENNEYLYTDKILNSNGTALKNLYNIGCQLQSAGIQNFAYEKAWMSDEAYNAMVSYDQKFNGQAIVDQIGYNELNYPYVKLDVEKNNSLNSSKDGIKVVYEKYMNEFLKSNGTISDAKWNEYVKAMENAGVKNMINILQTYVDSK